MTTLTAVHAYAIETPFGTLAYQIGAPDENNRRTFWFTPAGDTAPADAIRLLNSGVFTSDSTGIDQEATYEPRTPHTFMRQHKPLTINRAEYRDTFTAERYPDGHYVLRSGLFSTFTDSAHTKLTAYLNEHDATIYTAHEATELYDEARNAHASASQRMEEAQRALDAATDAENEAWQALQRTANPNATTTEN